MSSFLALQCYKCNMMQVKQEKKSSNKWSCSLCNEKQSVRQVFASSIAAKDIRAFVQEYNLSRNCARDRALSEFMFNADETTDAEDGSAGDLLSGAYSQAHLLRDECSHPQMIVQNKWNEYIPQDEGFHEEVPEEDTVDDVEFVTAMPENYGRKPKGRVRSAHSIEQYSLPQKQRRHVELSNRPFENHKKGLDTAEKDNVLPIFGSSKSSLASSLQALNPARIQHGQKLTAYKVPQKSVADARTQTSAASGLFRGRNSMLQKSHENAPIVEIKSKSLTHSKMPMSRYAPCLNSASEEVLGYLKEEGKCVSKWAKYMEYGEVACSEEAVQSYEHSSKSGNLVDAGQELRQSKQGSSIWSLRAASNVQYCDGMVKTELDELLYLPCMPGVEGGDEPSL